MRWGKSDCQIRVWVMFLVLIYCLLSLASKIGTNKHTFYFLLRQYRWLNIGFIRSTRQLRLMYNFGLQFGCFFPGLLFGVMFPTWFLVEFAGYGLFTFQILAFEPVHPGLLMGLVGIQEKYLCARADMVAGCGIVVTQLPSQVDEDLVGRSQPGHSLDLLFDLLDAFLDVDVDGFPKFPTGEDDLDVALVRRLLLDRVDDGHVDDFVLQQKLVVIRHFLSFVEQLPLWGGHLVLLLQQLLDLAHRVDWLEGGLQGLAVRLPQIKSEGLEQLLVGDGPEFFAEHDQGLPLHVVFPHMLD